MWKGKQIYIFVLLIVSIYSCDSNNKQQTKNYETTQTSKTIYDISLDELMEVNVIPDTNAFELNPTYDIPIEDLMRLEIVNEIVATERLTISYDIPLEDLLKLEIQLKKHKNKPAIAPSYDMSLNGLLEFEIKEEYAVKSHIKLSYDISMEGLLQIDLADLADEE